MTPLERLRAAKSRLEIAKLLGFTPKALAYLLYKQAPETKYKAFNIAKKTGGTRLIEAPVPQLKLLQQRLAALLLDCLEEIEAEHPIRRSLSHGFQRKRSIVTNAIPHRKCRYVLNLDLNDFFGTINFGRVRGFFLSDENFALSKDAAPCSPRSLVTKTDCRKAAHARP